MIGVILCHNELFVTQKCVESILASKDDKKNLKIIIVDNGSKDDTWTFLQQLPDLFVPKKNDENKWYTIAIAEVIDEYPNEDIYLLNNDIIVKDGWLSGLEELDKWGAIGATQLHPADERLITFAGGEKNFMAHKTMWEKREKELYGDNIHEELWLTFGACMINRKCYDSIGGLDKNLKFYCSDSDFSLRAKNAGWKIGVSPKMRVIHLGSYTTRKKMQSDIFFRMEVAKMNDQKKLAQKHKLNILNYNYSESEE